MTYLIEKPDNFAQLKVLGEVAKFDVYGLPSIILSMKKGYGNPRVYEELFS